MLLRAFASHFSRLPSFERLLRHCTTNTGVETPCRTFETDVPKNGSFRRNPSQIYSLRPQKQNRYPDTVLDPARSHSQHYIGKQAVPVRAHRHKIAPLLFHPLDDFCHRIAVGKLGLCGESCRSKFVLDSFQIRSVFSDFGTYRIRTVGSRSPSVSNVKQDHMALRECCKLLDVFNDRSVRRVPSRVTRMVLYIPSPFDLDFNCR